MTGRRKAGSRPITPAEILATVAITERKEALRIDLLDPEGVALIVAGALSGLKPILMFWPDGKQAHTQIPFEHDMPDPRVVVQAYRQCETCDTLSPRGVLKWII